MRVWLLHNPQAGVIGLLMLFQFASFADMQTENDFCLRLSYLVIGKPFRERHTAHTHRDTSGWTSILLGCNVEAASLAIKHLLMMHLITAGEIIHYH